MFSKMGIKTKKNHFIAFVRHGERADDSKLCYEKNWNIVKESEVNFVDPPLTKIGCSQAIVTGRYLKDYFKKLKPTKIIVKCSPYIGCIMTASNIASEL